LAKIVQSLKLFFYYVKVLNLLVYKYKQENMHDEQKVMYQIRVTGRVQGVGFRQACLREARFIGVSGYVKNNSDGSVFIEAKGTEGQIKQLIEWSKHGPSGYCFVEDISVDQAKPALHSSFLIRH
jgi:acylphosphatase